MATIFSGPGAASAFSSASGGKLYAYNALDAVTAQNIAPANPSRQRITFHNAGSVDIFVYPQYKLAVATNVQSSNAPTVAAPGGSFRVFANGGTLEIAGEVQQAWYALAASGSTGTCTVMDSNT